MRCDISFQYIQKDQQIGDFQTNTNGRINKLSFRTDGVPYMCSVGTDGNIVVWNLKERRLQAVHRQAHNDRIVSAQFLDNEPILVTSGVDNALKMWIFDDYSTTSGSTGICRLLKHRCGHGVPPHLVSFYGQRGLLSTSNDGELRISWLQKDSECRALGQRALKGHKLPKIKHFDSSLIKSRFWANVMTCHSGDNRVRLWSVEKMRLESEMLMPDMVWQSMSGVTCVCISTCGNFGFVGRVNGIIDQYSLQSAKHIQTMYEHNDSIRSLHVNIFNNVLISTSADKTIR
ncbi:hypothetical protein RFI_12246, partial [Reticulomyxa filosa]